MKFFFSLFFFLASFYKLEAQGKSYSDGHNGELFLPLGELSFVDEVIEFKRGKPQPIASACDSSESLGEPDFQGVAEHFTSLGCGGYLVLRFSNNALVNIEGPDLFVFEVGKFVETTTLEISKNGKNWIKVGEISGGVTSIDIEKSTKKGEVFHYIKLTDLGTDCTGKWPGADIDAVAAIGSGTQIDLNSSVLYAVNEYVLLKNAQVELDKVAKEIALIHPSKIIIEGHTDNTGTEQSNQLLSEKRAKSVLDYLLKKDSTWKNKLSISGYGSSMPIASNDTKIGQEKNRRVSIILLP